jgi:hypothetical protein
MGRREGLVENYLRKRVKEEGGQIRKLKWIGRRGAADNLVWWTFPRVALIECKAAGERVDPRSQQGRALAGMSRDGWPVFEVNSHAEVDEVLALVKYG